MLFAYAALLGWCGTKWPGWWRWPRPPHPDPEPWWRLVDGLIGAAGGIAVAGEIVVLNAQRIDGGDHGAGFAGAGQ